VKFRNDPFGAPNAPAQVSGSLRRKFEALGRADAKKYQNVQDYSRTHAVLSAEAIAQAGQHTVNQWLVRMVQPILAGNARLELTIKETQAELNNLRATAATSGRQAEKLARTANELKVHLDHLIAQHESNMNAVASLRMQAEQVMATWERYFQAIVSFYSRARTLKDKALTHNTPAQSPHFQSVELTDVGLNQKSPENRG
jgi:primosomal replication protein N